MGHFTDDSGESPEQSLELVTKSSTHTPHTSTLTSHKQTEKETKKTNTLQNIVNALTAALNGRPPK